MSDLREKGNQLFQEKHEKSLIFFLFPHFSLIISLYSLFATMVEWQISTTLLILYISLIHSCQQQFYLLIHSPIHSRHHSLTHASIHPFYHSLTHSFICSRHHSLTHSSINYRHPSLSHSSIHSRHHSLTISFIHSTTH